MAVKLAYEAWGEGPRTLMLLHSFTGDHTSFDHLRPLLGRELRAVVVDLPGHGGTPLPGRDGRAAHQETLQAVIDVVDRLGLQGVDLLGYSMGSRIALGAALAAPERFGRLILEGCSLGTGIQPDYWSELPRLDQPTLLLTGARDAKYTEMARRMATKLPAAYHSIIADCGHAPHLEAPEVYARELLAFLGAPLREIRRCASSRPI